MTNGLMKLPEEIRNLPAKQQRANGWLEIWSGGPVFQRKVKKVRLHVHRKEVVFIGGKPMWYGDGQRKLDEEIGVQWQAIDTIFLGKEEHPNPYLVFDESQRLRESYMMLSACAINDWGILVARKQLFRFDAHSFALDVFRKHIWKVDWPTKKDKDGKDVLYEHGDKKGQPMKEKVYSVRSGFVEVVSKEWWDAQPEEMKASEKFRSKAAVAINPNAYALFDLNSGHYADMWAELDMQEKTALSKMESKARRRVMQSMLGSALSPVEANQDEGWAEYHVPCWIGNPIALALAKSVALEIHTGGGITQELMERLAAADDGPTPSQERATRMLDVSSGDKPLPVDVTGDLIEEEPEIVEAVVVEEPEEVKAPPRPADPAKIITKGRRSDPGPTVAGEFPEVAEKVMENVREAGEETPRVKANKELNDRLQDAMTFNIIDDVKTALEDKEIPWKALREGELSLDEAQAALKVVEDLLFGMEKD